MNAITIKRTAMDLTFHTEIGDVTTLAGEHFAVTEGTPITVAQYAFNGSRLLAHVCPPHTAVQGWAWVFVDMLTEDRPEFPRGEFPNGYEYTHNMSEEMTTPPADWDRDGEPVDEDAAEPAEVCQQCGATDDVIHITDRYNGAEYVVCWKHREAYGYNLQNYREATQ